MKEKIALMLFIVLSSSCANFAFNTRSCENSPHNFLWPEKFMGNVFQFSPCTSIDALRIETGLEIQDIRDGIDREIASNPELPTDLYLFSRRMGCPKDSRDAFVRILFDNKLEIFGLDGKASNSSVVGRTRSKIEGEPALRTACFD